MKKKKNKSELCMPSDVYFEIISYINCPKTLQNILQLNSETRKKISNESYWKKILYKEFPVTSSNIKDDFRLIYLKASFRKKKKPKKCFSHDVSLVIAGK